MELLLCRVLAQPAQGFLQCPACREHVVVSRIGVVPAPYQVGKTPRRCRLHIVLRVGDAVVDSLHRAGAHRVAYLHVHLRGQVHLPGYLGDAAAPVSRFRKVLPALQPYPTAHIQVDAVFLYIYVVGRPLVAARVHGVFLVVAVYRLPELLLGQRVVFVRHPNVPKDVLVARLRAKGVVGKLGAVVIRPYRDQLELVGVAVVVGLEKVGAVLLVAQSGQFAPFLEGDALHLFGYLITVRVESQAVVLEIEYLEGVAFLVGHFLAAHRTHRTDTLGIDVRKGVRLVMVPYAIFLHVHVHMLHAAGKLEPAVPVFLRVNVPAAAHRVEPGVKLGVVGHVAAYARQALVIPQRHFLARLAAAHVHRLAFHPPLGAVPGFLGHFPEGLVAVFAFVVDDDVVRAFHRADLPVGGAVHAVVDAFHDEGHMLPRRGGQREHGLVVAVRVVQHEETLDQAFYPVQLHVVPPLYGALLFRAVTLHEPVFLPPELGVVVHLQCHVLVQRERQGEHVVAL